jgi:hypothetical protein
MRVRHVFYLGWRLHAANEPADGRAMTKRREGEDDRGSGGSAPRRCALFIGLVFEDREGEGVAYVRKASR